jgi:hypothetical protein
VLLQVKAAARDDGAHRQVPAASGVAGSMAGPEPAARNRADGLVTALLPALNCPEPAQAGFLIACAPPPEESWAQPSACR